MPSSFTGVSHLESQPIRMTDATAQSFVKLNIKFADGNIVMKTGRGKTIIVNAPAQGMISGREFTIDTIRSFSYDFD
jgi:hypothetical protein